MPENQNFKNHASRDPMFIFFILPVLLTDILLAVYATYRHWPVHARLHLWWIVMSIALFLTAITVRRYATKNQDRIIRLEERLRYPLVLSTAGVARAEALTLPQIIALRFASDAELPTLLDRALAETLTPKQIKENITSWRADYERV